MILDKSGSATLPKRDKLWRSLHLVDIAGGWNLFGSMGSASAR